MRPGDMTPVKAGDFVVVQADRGEDLGIITESYSLPEFLEKRFAMRAYMDEEDQNVSYILRLASPAEMKLLPEKFQDEEMIFKVRTCGRILLFGCLCLIKRYLHCRRVRTWLCIPTACR